MTDSLRFRLVVQTAGGVKCDHTGFAHQVAQWMEEERDWLAGGERVDPWDMIRVAKQRGESRRCEGGIVISKVG